jgi:hypothetical protein
MANQAFEEVNKEGSGRYLLSRYLPSKYIPFPLSNNSFEFSGRSPAGPGIRRLGCSITCTSSSSSLSFNPSRFFDREEEVVEKEEEEEEEVEEGDVEEFDLRVSKSRLDDVSTVEVGIEMKVVGEVFCFFVPFISRFSFCLPLSLSFSFERPSFGVLFSFGDGEDGGDGGANTGESGRSDGIRLFEDDFEE